MWQYAVKHDGQHKARLCACSNLMQDVEQEYSGVVQLKSLRIALLAAELNRLDVWAGDISNAYLTSRTTEKIYIVAGPEFGDLEGHTLIIDKALYGLCTSSMRYRHSFSDKLEELGYKPTYADPDVWYKAAQDGTCYEYVCVYVDDLMVLAKDPEAFFNTLKHKFGYKLKGVGPPEYHLGGNFGHDKDGVLYWGSKRYVEKLMDAYNRMFGDLPMKKGTPSKNDDHPELDETPILSEDGIKQYQSMIGGLQWAVTLGRFDILEAVMSLSRFRVMPREGHLERVKYIYGYLRKHPDRAIRFRPGYPDRSDPMFHMPEHDWMHSVYGNVEEHFPEEYPKPLGKAVRMTTCVDANLMHCQVTGHSCTGILHMLNQTPIDWFSKLQKQVETATYGSKFIAARTATEQIIDLRDRLASMGIPMEKHAWMLGDNQSVITQSTIPHSVLNKRWNALSYHRVRSAVAGRFLKFCYIHSTQNPSDVLTKSLTYSKFMPLVKPFVFWQGDTIYSANKSEIKINNNK